MSKTLDWNEYEKTARQAIAEGCVLLENKNNALPLSPDSTVSIFGRIQNAYYKSGTGSGGKVNVSKVYGIPEGLEKDGSVKINQELKQIYQNWEIENPVDEGMGWGAEPWSQKEMPLTDKIVQAAAAKSDTALIIIGRTAGEDKDNSNTKGAFLLSDEENDMLSKVRKAFKKMVVLLNTGNIIESDFITTYKPDAVMYVWQGGMLGGLGTADVLTGKVNPCGKLTDTIASSIKDYPSDANFGNPSGNKYCEDIFVGYRYFETFAKDKVRYPFGYGLSYTTFDIKAVNAKNNPEKQNVTVEIEVTNTGSVSGKEVVQLYAGAPQGKLGKALKVLAAFGKTKVLAAGEKQILNFTIPYYDFASYDDSGASGNRNCFVLEAGEYHIYAGNNVRSAKEVLSFKLDAAAGTKNIAADTKAAGADSNAAAGSDNGAASNNGALVLKRCEEALAPVEPFKRMHGTEKGIAYEEVPLRTINLQERISQRIPQEIKQTGNKGYKLCDVLSGKTDIKTFVAQFSDDDLCCLVRGEGMGSSLVTAGTASAFAGVSSSLRNTYGIPAVCCDDGPSGMRLDCGIKAFSLPNGTSLAATFNTELVEKLYSFTGMEMIANHVDNLLGPGMNIHRHPLNGRNFEYFSEDPYVTGMIGSAMLKGLQSAGATGTVKHFCGNNQETNRYAHNSVISQRALREIYLKGFELGVRCGAVNSVMTTYGLVNGTYTAVNYDLVTTLLRNDWGFDGIVMTDWWAELTAKPGTSDKTNFADMVHAQNDLYMCCPDGSKNASGDNTLASLQNGSLFRSELQRTAINVCNHAMHTPAMERLMGAKEQVKVINRPKDEDDINLEDVEFIMVGKETHIDLTYQECKKDAKYILAFDVETPGKYDLQLTGSSDLTALAQLPCTFFFQGIPVAGFVFNGSEGKDVTITKRVTCPTRFCICLLKAGANGLKLKELTIKFINNDTRLSWE